MRRLLILLCLVSPCLAQAPNARKLNVVIVAVSSFDNDPWSGNALLEQAIQTRAAELKAFFKKNFPEASITLLDPSETTYANLGSFFKGQFPEIASGNMTLLFVLSHGEAHQFDNPTAGSDLLIVAKDSDDSDTAHLLGSTISLSTDILGHLNGLAAGSIIFGFIDTCHSGAAANLNISVDTAIREKLGTKMMLMAATQSDQSTYSALFTQALLKLWESQPIGLDNNKCTAPQPSVETIQKTILSNLPTGFTLKATEAFPDVLIDFPGRFCIEQFAANSALVLVDNALPSTVVADFKVPTGPEYSFPIKASSVVPIGIARQKYDLSFSDGTQSLADVSIDLSAQPFYLRILGTPTPTGLAKTFEKAAALAQSFGNSAAAVGEYKLRAYAAYTAAGDLASVARLSADLKLSTIASDPTNVARLLPAASISEQHTIAASANARMGNFSIAGEQYRLAAENAKAGNDASWETLAQRSYLAYAAGGMVDKARSIRSKLKISLTNFCQGCEALDQNAKKSTGAAIELRDLSLKQLLTAQTPADQKAASILLANRP